MEEETYRLTPKGILLILLADKYTSDELDYLWYTFIKHLRRTAPEGIGDIALLLKDAGEVVRLERTANMPKKTAKKKTTKKKATTKKPKYTAIDWAYKVDNEGGLAGMVDWGGASCVDQYDLDEEYRDVFKEFAKALKELQDMGEELGYTVGFFTDPQDSDED
jgi:hypothetical protein